MSGTHSRLSPSKSAIWASCYGALAYIEKSATLPAQPSTIHAASGTLTHMIAEDLLKGRGHPASGAAATVDGFKFIVDDARLERVEKYAAAIRARGGMQFYEVRLPLDTVLLSEGESGTADAVVVDLDNHILEVHDLKDGNGIVYAKDNDQLILYALGALDAFTCFDNFKAVSVHIHQYKIGWYDNAEYTIAELDGHRERLRYAAGRNIELMHPTTSTAKILSALNPSDSACKWCPMAGQCVARNAAIAAAIPEAEMTTAPGVLTDAELGALLSREAIIKAAFDSWRAEAYTRAIAGSAIPGWKLSTGRQGPRVWAGDQDAIGKILYEAIQADAYTRTLISPTVAQKKLKKFPEAWATLQTSIVRSEGKISLVPEADARAPLSLDIPEFENILETGQDLI